MDNKFLSRGPSLDMEKIVEAFGGRFDMVIGASLRAKEIKRNNKESNRFEHTHPVVTALLEIQEGKVGREILDKLRKTK
jgi:DNA-directed RNA polymerase omega subunit